MIVFDLACDAGHRFEGWFGSSEDYAGQHARGLVTCPECGSFAVVKAPMAPAVPRKGNRPAAVRSDVQVVENRQGVTSVARGEVPPEVAEALKMLAQAQAKALEKSTWVGSKFAEQTRAMHYGERDPAPIHGQTDVAEAIELLEEGIAIAPLPFPVAPPEELN